MSYMADPFGTRPPDDFTSRVSRVSTNPDYVRLLWAGLAPSTRRTYSTAVRSYEEWCRRRRAEPWPATVSSLTGWVFDRAFGRTQDRLRGATIEKYVAALRSAHVDLNFEVGIFDNAHLKRLIQGAKYLFPHAPTRAGKKPPVSKDTLRDLVSPKATRGEDQKDTLAVNAALTTAWYGFLRLGEVVHTEADAADSFRFGHEKLSPSCISPSAQGDHFRLLLRSSKTDKERNGITLMIGATNDDTCPYKHMARWLEWGNTPRHNRSRKPLFYLSKGTFTRDRVLAILRSRLLRLGIPPGTYAGHSFRRGAAQHASNTGMSEEEIKLLGRWTSDSVRRYYKTSPSSLLSLQRRFGKGCSTAG